MALTLNNFTGFETQGAEEFNVVSSPTFNTSTPLRGTSSLGGGSADLPWVADGITDAGASYVFGALFRKAGNPSSDSGLLQVDDDTGATICGVSVNTSGALELKDAATGILDTSSVLNNDQIYLIEVFAELNSASGAWEWFIDGVSEGSGTGADFTDGNAFSSALSVLRFDAALGGLPAVDLDIGYILSGATSAANRLGIAEVFAYQNDQGASATPDGGFGTVGTDLNTGTWDLVAETPSDTTSGNVAIYTSAGHGTVDLTGPKDDANIDGDSNIIAIKGIWVAKRSNGGTSIHSVALGNDGDGNAPPETVITLTTVYATHEVLRETDLPLSTDLIRQGFETTGARDFDCGEMWAMLLHVPTSEPAVASAQVLSNYSQSGTAHMNPDVSGVQALPNYLQAGTANLTFPIAAIQILEEYLQTGTLTMNPDGAGAQILADLLQAGLPIQIFTVAGVQALADYLQSATATSIKVFNATGVQTLDDYLQAGIGAHPHSLSGIQTLADYLQSGTAVQIFIATGAQSLPDFLQSGNGIMLPSGVGDMTLADYLQTGSVTHTQNVSIIGAQALADYIQSATAVLVQPEGSGAQTLSEYLQAGAVVEFFATTASQALGEYLQAASGSEIIIGSAASVLDAIVQSGSAVMAPSGLAASILSDYAQAGAGIEIFISGADQTLSSLTQEAFSGISFTGVSAQALAGFVQNGNGAQIFTGTGAQTLAAFAQAGTGVVVFSGPVFVDEFLALLGNLDVIIKAAPQVIVTLG